MDWINLLSQRVITADYSSRRSIFDSQRLITGKAVIATSKQEAVAVARNHLDQGRSNIDLGVMQLNFYWHGSHFKNIEEVLTPSSNINYGAKFLSDLYRQHGSWQKAVRYYHSSSPEHYKQYSRKVLISWLGV